jgi:hypothetical protein
MQLEKLSHTKDELEKNLLTLRRELKLKETGTSKRRRAEKNRGIRATAKRTPI